MHQQALDWCRQHATDDPATAIDLGGRETNGHARWLWPNTRWTVVDAVDGPGVDIVHDAATYKHPELVDVVTMLEVAEHTPRWFLIVNNAIRLLKPLGLFVFTAAGPGRPVHGLNHDDPDQPGYYHNIGPDELAQVLAWIDPVSWDIDVAGEDIRAWAHR